MSALATSPVITWRAEEAAVPSPRVDLRTGVLAAGFVEGGRGASLAEWAERLADARARWRLQDRIQPLMADAPDYIFEDGAAAHLDALLRGAGVPMRGAGVQFAEADLVAAGPSGLQTLERLRARGWGVSLLCAPACPLPLGGRARSLFTEIVAETPADLSPALALADPDLRPLTRRIRAAQAAGLVTTALGVTSPAQAGLLVALGFDRGAGPGYPL